MALQTEMIVVVSIHAEVIAGTVVLFGPIAEGGECSGDIHVSSILNIQCGLSLSSYLFKISSRLLLYVLIVSLLTAFALVIDNDLGFNKLSLAISSEIPLTTFCQSVFPTFPFTQVNCGISC